MKKTNKTIIIASMVLAGAVSSINGERDNSSTLGELASYVSRLSGEVLEEDADSTPVYGTPGNPAYGTKGNPDNANASGNTPR